MRILVDADACPVKAEIIKIAKTNRMEVYFFADINHQIQVDYGCVITADQGMDSVDLKLINAMKTHDLVITADYGVASLAIGKGGYVLHPSGMEISSLNIDQLMFERHIGKMIRKQGRYGKGPKKRTREDNDRFLASLERLVLTYK